MKNVSDASEKILNKINEKNFAGNLVFLQKLTPLEKNFGCVRKRFEDNK